MELHLDVKLEKEEMCILFPTTPKQGYYAVRIFGYPRYALSETCRAREWGFGRNGLART